MKLNAISNHSGIITNAMGQSISTPSGGHITVDAHGNVTVGGGVVTIGAMQQLAMANTGAMGAMGVLGATGPTGTMGSIGSTGAIPPQPNFIANYPLLRTIRWSFDQFETIHPVYDYDLSRQELQIHLHAWAGSDGEDVYDQTVVVLPNGLPHLCFGSAESFGRFQRWRERYQSLFGDADMALHGLPSLPQGRHTLSLVPLASKSLSSDRLIEILTWISANVRRPFYFTHGLMAFEDDADAFSFQMKFKGT